MREYGNERFGWHRNGANIDRYSELMTKIQPDLPTCYVDWENYNCSYMSEIATEDGYLGKVVTPGGADTYSGTYGRIVRMWQLGADNLDDAIAEVERWVADNEEKWSAA